MAVFGSDWRWSGNIRGNMNLRVDLILESEQRSGSVVNLKSTMRIASIVGPIILLFIAGSVFTNARRLNTELNMLEGQMEIAGPKQEAAAELKEDLATNLGILNELEGWQKSHIDWNEQLLGLQREVPATIQLNVLRISQALQLIDNRIPARVFTLVLKGKAVGKDAEHDVDYLQRRLLKAPAFSSVMEKVEIPPGGFRAVIEKDGSKSDRIFQLDCMYQARTFK